VALIWPHEQDDMDSAPPEEKLPMSMFGGHALVAASREGVLYRGCGIIATHLGRQGPVTEYLSGFMREDVRQGRLMLTVNEINQRYGNHTVAPGATLNIRRSGHKVRFQYPLLGTD